MLLITTPEEAESQLITKVYPVGDLVIPIQSGGLVGSEHVIRKPFTGDQLADVLTRAIEAKRGRR